MSDNFPVTVQIRTPFPVPVDRLDRLRKLVNNTKFAHGIARDAPALMQQKGDDLVISYSFVVPDYDTSHDDV